LTASKDDVERQQVVRQMAAAMERRAQLQQQQQPSSGAAHSPSGHAVLSAVRRPADTPPAGSPLGLAGTPAATAAAGGGAGAGAAATPSGGGFGLMTPSASPGNMTPLGAAASGVYSSRSNSLRATATPPASTAAAAAAGGGDTPTSTAAASAAAAGGGSSPGLGGLFARGLADLGIVDEAASGATAAAATVPSRIVSGAAAGLPAGASSLRPLTAPEAGGGGSELGLPPGVTPVVGGRRGPVGSPAAPPPAAAPEPPQAQPQPAATVAASASSAAAASALLSSLTGARARVAQTQAVQAPQQQQQQPAGATAASSAAADFDAQVAAVRQLSLLQAELAEHRLAVVRLRQQADEDHDRHLSEVSRLRADLDAAHQRAAADVAAARDEAAGQVLAAEALARRWVSTSRVRCWGHARLGQSWLPPLSCASVAPSGSGVPTGLVCAVGCCLHCREVELQRSLLTAQLSAQSAAIQQEREALSTQRLSTDMLASLSEQVRFGWPRSHATHTPDRAAA
jgi:hypothetical protein